MGVRVTERALLGIIIYGVCVRYLTQTTSVYGTRTDKCVDYVEGIYTVQMVVHDSVNESERKEER